MKNRDSPYFRSALFAPSRRSAQQGFTSSWRSAQQGFTSSWRSAQQGFTLIEMLIALAIFGMLTAAGVALLSVTARTEEAADRQLARVGDLRRTGALLTADLAQAVARPHRDADGRPQIAFAGGDGSEAGLLAFVRADTDLDSGLPALRRVGYRVANGRLERLAFAAVDGSDAAVAVPLIDGVRQLRLRYRDRTGAWLPEWRPTDGTRLPVAVELVVDTAHDGVVRQLFLVGTGR
jgi:general secretion pathway protein J